MCELTLVNTIFEDNIAITQGGSIHYTYRRPQMTNITFTNNTAVYGSNISSYAFKINFVDSDYDKMKLTNVGSGIVHNEELKFALRDFDDQVMVLNDVDQITVASLQTDISSIQGVNSKVLVNGISTFDEFISITDPGSTNVEFKLTSKAIDSDKVKDVLGLNVSDNILSIDFRYCKPGEYILNNTCFQ